MKAVVDNDILLKGACYGLLQEIATTLEINAGECGVLGVARFVVRSRIKRAELNQDIGLMLANLATFLANAVALEPGTVEQSLAAQLEASAQQLGLSLDAGESQLCAIVIERSISRLVTGDKRAITALERIIGEDANLLKLCGKLMCLEQLVLMLLASWTFDRVRGAVCLEPEVDKTMTICFGCRSSSIGEPEVREGLDSYIRDLRSGGSRVLVP